MRTIDPLILEQLEGKELRTCGLFHTEIDGTSFDYTDYQIPVFESSRLYTPRPLKIDAINYSTKNIVDQVKVQIGNADRMMSDSFTGGTPQGSDVEMKLAILNSNHQVITGSAMVLFIGTLDSWGLSEDKISITATNEFSQWTRKTFAKHSATCRWKVFKGTECTYSGGEDWCDRSYARCASLGNTNNFGGFRWLPSTMEREIWWGRVQGQPLPMP